MMILEAPSGFEPEMEVLQSPFTLNIFRSVVLLRRMWDVERLPGPKGGRFTTECGT
jgi:hypothetical protein